MAQLRFGDQERLELRMRAQDMVLDHGPASAVDDLCVAVQHGLDSPLDCPAFRQMLVPGDKLAIALEPGIPQLELLAGCLVRYLLENGVTAEQLQIIVSNQDSSAANRLADMLKRSGFEGLSLIEYAGVDKAEQAYLGADVDAEPIYICRAIHEADVVLPIFCVRDKASFQYSGSRGIVPWFVDVATQRRWRATTVSMKGNASTQSDVADRIGRMLGVHFVLGVITGENQSITAIVGGDPAAVASQGQTILCKAWQHEVDSTVDLVIASIQGGPENQSWDNVARSIHAAESILSDQGSVVICSELESAPGPALMQLASLEDEEKLVKRLLRSDHADAAIAICLLAFRHRHRIYLLSKLAPETIEDLGIAAIASVDEIQHLMEASGKCLILESAPIRSVTIRQAVNISQA